MPRVQANGIELHYEEQGQGEPLLLMAPTGWPGSVWQLEQVPFFAQHYRVITYDQRGTGGSSCPPDQPFDTRVLADDALALLRGLNAYPAHVLGFSMGGRSAQLMALDEPAAFRSLILAASHPGSPGGREGIPLRMAVHLGEHGYGLAFWQAHLHEELPFTPEFRASSPDKVRRLAETITGGQPPLEIYLRHVLARGGHAIGDRLRDLRVPTLVAVGAEDRVGGDHVRAARDMAEVIPNAAYAEVRGARHLFPWEAPELANPLMLEFLRSRTATPV